MTRKQLKPLALLTALATAVPALNGAAAIPEKPNVVILFADDLGYADLGCQGSDEVISPRIDSIAENGIRFTDGYVTAAQCSPSRAGLITGRYQQRFGYDVNLGWTHTIERKLGLPADEPTIAERLKAAGYTTGVIGKWDLGAGPAHHPNERGFDYFYGFVGGSRSHAPKVDNFPNTMLRNKERIDETDWSSDIYGKEAADFILRHRREPFFLYVSFTAPHWPMEAKEEDMEKFAHIEDLHRRTFLAMMAGLDRGVGTILDSLRKAGVMDRTLIIFLSDNGGATGPERIAPDEPFHRGANVSRNDPLRGHKGQLYEGGIRIPFMAAWPGVIEPGQISDEPVISIDIAATAAALGGADEDMGKPLDGVDLTPFLSGDRAALPERNLYWRVKNQSAIRSGDWKYLKIGASPPELYHLEEDIDESENRINEERERARELRKELRDWLGELPRPAW